MSPDVVRVASLFSIALLSNLLPAQANTATVAGLRQENATLREQVKRLQAKLDANTKKQQVRWGLGVQAGPGQRGKLVIAKRNAKAGGKGLDLVIKPGTEVTWVRVSDSATNLFFDAKFNKALTGLRTASGKLDAATTPLDARKTLDEVERMLIEVRRALWVFQQERKKKPAKTSERRRVTSVQVQLPVLSAPIELKLDWPVLSNNPNDQLFFSFRRF